MRPGPYSWKELLSQLSTRKTLANSQNVRFRVFGRLQTSNKHNYTPDLTDKVRSFYLVIRKQNRNLAILSVMDTVSNAMEKPILSDIVRKFRSMLQRSESFQHVFYV